MRRAFLACLIPLAFSALPLHGAQYSGSVRAADQFVPGATITAQQGTTKVTAFTDENGRYSMDLAPGVWDIRVDMFEFTAAAGWRKWARRTNSTTDPPTVSSRACRRAMTP